MLCTDNGLLYVNLTYLTLPNTFQTKVLTHCLYHSFKVILDFTACTALLSMPSAHDTANNSLTIHSRKIDY